MRLFIVRWGERLYLLRPAEVARFCKAIGEGEEPRSTVYIHDSGLFLLRQGDHKKPAAGLPEVPPKWKHLLEGLEPVSGTVKPGLRYLDRAETAAWKAWKSGDSQTAADLASDLLKRARYGSRWNYGNLVHDANQLLGLVALREGRTEDAKGHLLAAGRTPGSPQLNSYGPDMILAGNLLKAGEREVVIEYLDLVGRFWKEPKRLASWKAQINAGELPRLNGSQ